MKVKVINVPMLEIIFACLAVNALPSTMRSSPPSSSLTLLDEISETSHCEPTELTLCSKIKALSQLPNLYGHTSSRDAGNKVKDILLTFPEPSSLIVSFFCTLYLPPCSGNKSLAVQLPCRQMCEQAAVDARRLLINDVGQWPFNCQILPTEHCLTFVGSNSVQFVETSIRAIPSRSLHNDVASFASLDVELGNDEDYEVEVVSLSPNHIPERRYDIVDLGDPTLFHGWTDVQGTGAANDYCRVIGKNKRRYLSCNLAGSTGQGHHYVSKQGFEVGHPNTWFMRDMDGDRRDDYCRCVGSKTNSKVTCMKAGEHGFYGSTVQGGHQHTFAIPNSDGCVNKQFNPMFGERSL